MILLLGNNMEAHTLRTHETKSPITQLPAPTIAKQQEQQNSHHKAEKNKSGEHRKTTGMSTKHPEGKTEGHNRNIIYILMFLNFI
jgi:hypothetical protein